MLFGFITLMVILIPSAIFHEYAHGWMAERLGDPTAKFEGRLTLDPRAHVDLWGTLLMPTILFFLTAPTGVPFIFAYAKPVPFNPYNLRNQKWGPALVAIAGPIANLILAFCLGLVVRFFPLLSINTVLVDIISINLMLLVFNLVPVPPLDGSKLLYTLLPDNANRVKFFLERYGFFILIFFVMFLSQWLSPVISALFRIIVGV